MVLGSKVVLCFVEQLFEGLDSFVAGGKFSLGDSDLFFKGGVLFDQLTHISIQLESRAGKVRIRTKKRIDIAALRKCRRRYLGEDNLGKG